MDTGSDGQDGGARGGARFQGLVGVCSILERKALIDVNAHLSRSHHLEQLVRGSFKRIASLYVVEEDWARQKQRTLDVVEARRRLAQAHLTRPGLTDLDRCPVQNLGTAGLPDLNRMRYPGFHKNISSLCF